MEARNDEKWRQEYMKFSELMNEKKEEGRAEGRAEGREEGKVAERTAIAREMLMDNEPIDKIMRYSKLTKEEILAIKM